MFIPFHPFPCAPAVLYYFYFAYNSLCPSLRTAIPLLDLTSELFPLRVVHHFVSFSVHSFQPPRTLLLLSFALAHLPFYNNCTCPASNRRQHYRWDGYGTLGHNALTLLCLACLIFPQRVRQCTTAASVRRKKIWVCFMESLRCLYCRPLYLYI